jgi:hypothetical protein
MPISPPGFVNEWITNGGFAGSIMSMSGRRTVRPVSRSPGKRMEPTCWSSHRGRPRARGCNLSSRTLDTRILAPTSYEVVYIIGFGQASKGDFGQQPGGLQARGRLAKNETRS